MGVRRNGDYLNVGAEVNSSEHFGWYRNTVEAHQHKMIATDVIANRERQSLQVVVHAGTYAMTNGVSAERSANRRIHLAARDTYPKRHFPTRSGLMTSARIAVRDAACADPI